MMPGVTLEYSVQHVILDFVAIPTSCSRTFANFVQLSIPQNTRGPRRPGSGENLPHHVFWSAKVLPYS